MYICTWNLKHLKHLFTIGWLSIGWFNLNLYYETWSFHHFHPFSNGMVVWSYRYIYLHLWYPSKAWQTILAKKIRDGESLPILLGSLYGIYTFIWIKFHGSFGQWCFFFQNIHHQMANSSLFSLWKQGVSCSLCLKRIVECAVSGWPEIEKSNTQNILREKKFWRGEFQIFPEEFSGETPNTQTHTLGQIAPRAVSALHHIVTCECVHSI